MELEFKRTLDLSELTKKKSMFLFGPRSTGKTFLLKRQLGERALIIDLLKSQFYLPLSQNPSKLADMIEGQEKRLVIIDEIQKLPILLDEVHHLIEEKNIRFLLTGSSARKLKHEFANMLGGRAGSSRLFPLTWKEMADAGVFDLDRCLRYGSIPRVVLSEDPQSELYDYVDLYLKEEIIAEALVRNLPIFSRFLKLAAIGSGEQINYANIASDVGLAAKTIRDYYEILDDTLLGYELPVWKSGRKRKAVATSKHYLFDCGVLHTLAGTQSIDRNSDLYGKAFEHFVINEIRAYQNYTRRRWELSYWRTHQGDEVDLVIDERYAIEIKCSSRISSRDMKGLMKIKEEAEFNHRIIISTDPIDQQHEGIQLLHWRSFFSKLWEGHFD